MNASSTVAPLRAHEQRRPRQRLDEAVLLRTMVERKIMHSALLRVIDIERAGSGTHLSLLNWMIVRGHINEETLTAAVAACMEAPERTAVTRSFRARPSHLRLVYSRPHPRSSASSTDATTCSRRRALFPYLVRRPA